MIWTYIRGDMMEVGYGIQKKATCGGEREYASGTRLT